MDYQNGPGYQPNGYYPPPQPPYQNNGLATAAFVMSLVGLLCCSPLAVAGLIMGAVALSKHAVAPFPNRWMAIAAIVIGGLAVLVTVIGMLTGFWSSFMDSFMDGFYEGYYGF